MKRSRVPTLFFVMFLMIITPLTPMTSATNARAETVTAFISWTTGPGSVTVDDQSANYVTNVSGTYVRSEFNFHYSHANDFMDTTLPKASFQNWNKGQSLMWIDVPSSWGNFSDYWGIALHNVHDYNQEVSQYENSDNPGFNESNFCLFQETHQIGSYPVTEYYQWAASTWAHWCAPANLTVNSFTYPWVDINIDYTTTGTEYTLFWDILDCASSSVIEGGVVEFDGQSSTVPIDLFYANLTSTSGDYKVYVQLQQNTNVLESFTTACTGTQNGNSGGNNPPSSGPIISSHQSVIKTTTGLYVGETQVTNLTANTAYMYDQYLYPTISDPSTGTVACDESGGHLWHEDASMYIGGAYTGAPKNLVGFVLGSNDSNALPYVLNSNEHYCYSVTFYESAQDSTVSVSASTTFMPLSGFNGCNTEEWCWDVQKSHGTGLSFSQNGHYVTYFDDRLHGSYTTSADGSGEAIANHAIPPGKWYWEFEIDRVAAGSSDMWAIIGVHTGSSFGNTGPSGIGIGLDSAGQGWGFDSNAFAYHNNQHKVTSGVSSWDDEEFYNIGIALDNEAGNLWYSINGQWLTSSGSSSSVEPSTGAIPIFGQDSNGNLAEWDAEHGVNGLANTTVYPAVSDTSDTQGHTFRILTFDWLEFAVPSGFTGLPSDGFSTSDAEDTDGDGIPDDLDMDDDNDGVSDDVDFDPINPCVGLDSDGDGMPDDMGSDWINMSGGPGDGGPFNVDCAYYVLLMQNGELDWVIDDDDDNDGVSDDDDCAPQNPNAWEIDDSGTCVGEQTDDNEIEFCYDYQNNDLEDSYATEITCTDAGFMWSTDELKNLDISLSWAWGDYNNDGTNAANLDVFVEYPTTDTGSQVFTGLHQIHYILQITELDNNQLLWTNTLTTMMELGDPLSGVSEYMEIPFPEGELEYCIHVEIREQASTDTVSLDGICEMMDVDDAFSDDDDLCYGPGDYLIVENSIESSMNGRYFPSVGYEADPDDLTKIIEGDAIYWYKGENLDGSPGFGWAFYLAHLELQDIDKWVALEGTNPPQDLQSEVDHVHEPWGSDSCKPDGDESNYGHITYYDVSSDDQDGTYYLHSNVRWNPYPLENGDDGGNFELHLHAFVNAEGVSQVIVDYEVSTQVHMGDQAGADDIYFTGTTGTMTLNSQNEVNYNIDFSTQYDFTRHKSYCIELLLRVPGGDDLDSSIGCLYIGDAVVDTSEVDWSSNLETGSTWVSSAQVGKEGHLTVDDDYDTAWVSEFSCNSATQEIIIDLPNNPEYHLVSGVSLEWYTSTIAEYQIFAWSSNENWDHLVYVDTSYLEDYWNSPIHHIFHKIEANRIKIVCQNSFDDNVIELAEIQIHQWQDSNSGNNDMMDAYYPNDLSDGADVYTSSTLGGNIGPKIIDNDFSTSWESSESCEDSTQDVMIDLGQEYFIGGMKVTWGYTSYDNYHFGGEIKVWSEQNGWNNVMNMHHSIEEQPAFYHLYPTNGQKIMLKCLDSDLNLKISEIEIFEAKSDWHQFDFDNDGKNNGNDQCFIGQTGWFSDQETDHDDDGCYDDTEDWDDDNDNIQDENDNCPKGQFNWNSWDEGNDYDHDGCFDATEDNDDDDDGVLDLLDNCSNTRLGAGVDLDGCEISFADGDGDGVADSYDQCPDTFNFNEIEVDMFTGCPLFFDSDGDGVSDQDDAFPDDPSEQFDDDDDGVGNNADACPNTQSGDFVDVEGCTVTLPDNDPTNETNNDLVNETVNETANETAVDTDGDGVNDFDLNGTVLDNCPDTEEGVEVDEFGCPMSTVLPPQLAAALDFILNIDSLLGLPDGTLEIMFAAIGMLFGVIRFVGKRTMAGKSKRVEKYASEIRLARSRRELENLERRITKDNEKKLLPPGGFGDLMELIETRAIELGEMDMATQVRESAMEAESMRESHERMLEEMEGTREAVAGLQDELSQMRRKGPPGKGRKRKGPPRRRGGDDSGYKMQQSGGPRRPSLHPADLDGDGFVTDEEKRIYRERMEQEDQLWEYD